MKRIAIALSIFFSVSSGVLYAQGDNGNHQGGGNNGNGIGNGGGGTTPGGSGGSGSDGGGVPLDGGLSLLLVAGAGYGAKKAMDKRRAMRLEK